MGDSKSDISISSSTDTLGSYENVNGKFSIHLSILEPPVFKAILSGNATMDDAREVEQLLEETFTYLEGKYGEEPKYFLVDVSDFSGTTWRAKLHLQNLGKRIFKERKLNHLVRELQRNSYHISLTCFIVQVKQAPGPD